MIAVGFHLIQCYSHVVNGLNGSASVDIAGVLDRYSVQEVLINIAGIYSVLLPNSKFVAQEINEPEALHGPNSIDFASDLCATLMKMNLIPECWRHDKRYGHEAVEDFHCRAVGLW